MLVFITSLRHPRNSLDYSDVERQFEGTFGSMQGQLHESFGIVVVGNVRPPVHFSSSARFVEVDFPPPSDTAGARTGGAALEWDKGTKLAAGLIAAKEFNPTHAMFVDADDFVSNKLAGFVSRNVDENGWYVEDGYFYNSARAVVWEADRFNTRCGTSHIISWNLAGVPEGINESADQVNLARAYGLRIRYLFGSHTNTVRFASDIGTPLAPLPFRGALYTVGTGENHSGVTKRGIGMPVTSDIAREFSVPVAPDGMQGWFSANSTSDIAVSALRGVKRSVTKLRTGRRSG